MTEPADTDQAPTTQAQPATAQALPEAPALAVAGSARRVSVEDRVVKASAPPGSSSFSRR